MASSYFSYQDKERTRLPDDQPTDRPTDRAMEASHDSRRGGEGNPEQLEENTKTDPQSSTTA